ncbi:MAG TPA: redoxin domain-containing protein [Vicinamibacterales bacterium]|nr:redoxin domain-containing protein [Vicinamibacterales bacterium]
MKMLEAGIRAPEFTLPTGPKSRASLTDYRGRPVVLVFYPADWSPVCGDQLALYNELGSEFARFNAALLPISVDGVWSHAAFSSQRNYNFPLWSDFEPKGHVSRLYGVYNERDGCSRRALFVIDAQGVIAWSYLSPDAVNPGADGILTALEAMPGNRS